MITLSYPDRARGRQELEFAWEEGRDLRHYLRQKKLIARNFLCYTYNGQGKRVRIGYVPADGETITLKFSGGAMS